MRVLTAIQYVLVYNALKRVDAEEGGKK